MLRSHTCGDVRKDHVGQTVTLCGWVDTYRDHHGLVFIDLRDRYGKTQVVFDLGHDESLQETARSLRKEDVINVTGEVAARAEKDVNPEMATGEVDVRGRELTIYSRAKTPPFEPRTDELPGEELRLRYRFIDLRRDELQQAIIRRHKITKLVRDYFDERGFLDIETPILGKSTPEGARDYLVPSRVHPGQFYALPQSPQIFKQILMVAGFDRYMQIARCFRDEDLRADRQPEFTQIDAEMAFVTREDIYEVTDGLVARLCREFKDQEVTLPLKRLTYADAMERYGTDKPDTRFGMELVDCGEVAKACDFGVFSGTIERGGRVRGVCAPGAADKYSRKDLDKTMKDFVAEYGAKGLAYMKVADGKLESTIAKFFSDELQQKLIADFDASPGDLLLFVADQPSVTSAALAALRNRLGKELELYDPEVMDCLWVVDFPLFAKDEETGRWVAEHHMFCQPVEEDLPLFETDPGAIRAQSYDLVVNGYECASGSIRIHDPEVQQKVFDLVGFSAEDAEDRFGFLLEALRYGAPPHGGIALGLDRWIMLLAGYDNIRDVIAFPKTQKASDLLSGAPGTVDPRQLKELSIKTDLPEKAAGDSAGA